MATNQELLQKAKSIINQVIYATIATADRSAQPWNSPVFCAYDEQLNFYWSSHPQSQHSRNIAENNRIFMVIFNSKAGEGEGTGIYIEAVASELNGPQEIKKALSLLGERRNKPFLFPEKFIGEGPQRIYKAIPMRAWLNDADQDKDGDFIRDYRIPVELNDLRKII